jgi:hypothetical protein
MIIAQICGLADGEWAKIKPIVRQTPCKPRREFLFCDRG